jgi:hypothetical protein
MRICGRCGVTAHAACYDGGKCTQPGDNEADWLCDPCCEGILHPACALCPSWGGSLRAVSGDDEKVLGLTCNGCSGWNFCSNTMPIS